MFDQLFQVKKQLMELLGGVFCQTCNYAEDRALIFTYKECSKAKIKGVLNVTRYRYYLKNLHEARHDLEILCYNCQRRKMNRQCKRGDSQYQKYGKPYDVKLRKKIMTLLNQYNCVNCGETDFEVLEINHIKGNGSSLTKLFKSKRKEWLHYLKNPQNVKEYLQILCKNCNKLKQFRLLEASSTF